MDNRNERPSGLLLMGILSLVVGLGFIGLCIVSLANDSEAWVLPLGGILVGLAFAFAAFFVLMGEAWARGLLLVIAFGAALVGLCAGIAGDLSSFGGIFYAVIVPALLVAFFGVLAHFTTTPAASRHLTGNDGKFVNYLALQTGVQVLCVIGIVLYSFNIVDGWVVRADLTEDNRFSLSDYSLETVASLDSPLTIRAYFTQELPPRIEPIRRQVFDMLYELEKSSRGKVRVLIRNPQESAADESEAEQYGVRPAPFRVYEGVKTSDLDIYGGLVLVYGDKQSDVINVAPRYAQGYEGLSGLEYDLVSRIWQLTNEKPKVGLTGYLESKTGGQPWQGGGRPRPEFNNIRRLLGDAVDLEVIDLKQQAPDPKEMPLLMVVRPKEFTDVEVYRLDQYLMKGGRVIMFITQGTLEQSPFGGGGLQYRPFKTGLEQWLEHNGLRVPNQFVCHLGNAMDTIVREIDSRGRPVGRVRKNWFMPIISKEKDGFNESNPAVSSLVGINLFWPHPIDIVKGKLGGKTATPLVTSHERESWRWTDLNRIMRARLTDADRPTSAQIRPSHVVVAVEGKFSSFFAARPVPPSVAAAEKKAAEDAAKDEDGKKDGEDEKKDGEKPAPKAPEVVKESPDTQLVVVGNSIFISDLAVPQVNDQTRQRTLLASNLIDWLSRSKELISLRAKQFQTRDLVDEEYDERLKELTEAEKAGEISAAQAQKEMKVAAEMQEVRWRRLRWFNIGMPCSVILMAGIIVLILRKTMRKVPPSMPEPVPPESAGGGSDD